MPELTAYCMSAVLFSASIKMPVIVLWNVEINLGKACIFSMDLLTLQAVVTVKSEYHGKG